MGVAEAVVVAGKFGFRPTLGRCSAIRTTIGVMFRYYQCLERPILFAEDSIAVRARVSRDSLEVTLMHIQTAAPGISTHRILST